MTAHLSPATRRDPSLLQPTASTKHSVGMGGGRKRVRRGEEEWEGGGEEEWEGGEKVGRRGGEEERTVNESGEGGRKN